MKILVACEKSGTVREAFRRQGHDAWSCDIDPALDDQTHHIVGDAIEVSRAGSWELMVAHPPCTYITYASTVHWKKPRWKDHQQAALVFFFLLMKAPIERIAIENPRGLPYKLIRKPDDIIEPYEFGDPYSKRTYLWLKNLPPLMKTLVCATYEKNWVSRKHGFARSITFPGIADAMSKQWGTR